MALLVTSRLVLMLVLSFMALDTTEGETCLFSEVTVCLPNFLRYVGWSFDVLRISDADFTTLCGSVNDAESCVDRVQCALPPEFKGVVPAYNFLCNNWDTTESEYKTQHSTCLNDVPKLQSCFVMYPQAMPMGAMHIVNKAEKFLDTSFYRDAEYWINDAFCVHLSTSRDIFCSESFVRAKCGKVAGEWHSSFTATLFRITPGSITDISARIGPDVRGLNMRDCPGLQDVNAIKACELSNKCVPVLINFAKNVRFGVFTFTESDLNSFCGLSEADLKICVSQLVSRCSLIDVFTFNGSLLVHKKLCSDQYKAKYLEHRDCLSSSTSETGFTEVLGCTNELMGSYKSAFLSTSDARSVETTLCNAVATYLVCLEEKLTVLCHEEAAKFQRKMTRFMLVPAFQLTFCTSSFDFQDMERSVEDGGPALKANELNSALLVATVTVVVCSHYIKCIYYF